jgi:hypothetical protein
VTATGTGGSTASPTVNFTTMAEPGNTSHHDQHVGDGRGYGIGVPIVLTFTKPYPRHRRGSGTGSPRPRCTSGKGVQLGRGLFGDDATKQLTVTRDGKIVKTIPAHPRHGEDPSFSGNVVVMPRAQQEIFDSSTSGIPVNAPGGYRGTVYAPDAAQWLNGVSYIGDPAIVKNIR